MKNLIEKIKKAEVSERYNITTDDLLTILNSCDGSIVTALTYAFKAGYIQGSRAKKNSPTH